MRGDDPATTAELARSVNRDAQHLKERLGQVGARLNAVARAKRLKQRQLEISSMSEKKDPRVGPRDGIQGRPTYCQKACCRAACR
jgi:hypothetical protein